MTRLGGLQLLPLLKGCTRMAMFCGVCATLAGVLSVRNARSAAAESSLQFGRQLVGIGALQGSVSHLRVNGNDVLAGGHFVDMDLALVLKRFRAECSERAWQMGELSGELANAVPADAPLTLASTSSEDEGVVICLTPSRPSAGVSDFLARVRETAATGELGQLGQIHYLYARRNKSGGTNVIGVWTAAKFNVPAFLGRDAEKTGEDQPEVPRIPGSQRTLHAELVGSGYAVRQYATDRAPTAANQFYLDIMPQRGWKAVPTGEHENSDKHSTFAKNGALVIIAASKVDDGHTQLSILTMAASALVTAQMRHP